MAHDATGPRTLCGLLIRTFFNRAGAEMRNPLVDQIEREGWVDVEATVAAAFDVGVARIYRPDSDVRAIRELVADAARRFGSQTYPPREAEALIRASRGESTVDVSGIAPELAYQINLLTLSAIGDSLALTAAQVDELIVEAETLAHRRGLHPTPTP